MKNWFDRESHPSDELIHWQDRDFCERGWGVGRFKKFDEYVDAVRAAYDVIHNSDPKVKAAYELLMDAQRHKSSMEEGEREAGENL